MSLPAIGAGLFADDYELALAVTRDPLGAYAFLDSDPVKRRQAILNARESGSLAWWVDTEFHQRFLRPLSSLSLALDFRLSPDSALPLHVENSLLYALIVLIVAALYRALDLRAAHLGLATFFFAMQAAQSMTVGWISGRSTLLSTLVGLLCVLMHVSYLRTRQWKYALASPVVFALALASAEAGLAALAYAFAFSWVDGAVRPASDRAPLPRRSRLLAFTSLAVVALVWQVIYRLGGYGVKRSAFYIDAASAPLEFLSNLLLAIPVYLASQLTVPFAAASGFLPHGLLWFCAFSLALLFVTRRLWLPVLHREPRARALGLGAVLAIIPLGSTLPQDRLVSFIAVGVCGILASIVFERLSPENVALPRAGAKVLFVLHAIVAPALFIPYLFGSATGSLGGGVAKLSAALGDDPRPVLLINAPFQLPVHFFSEMRQWTKQPPLPIDVLYAGVKPVTLTRSDERTLELAVERGYFASTFERLERDPRVSPMRTGDEIVLQRMHIRVLADRDGMPTRVRFDLARPLSGSRLFAWQGKDLVELPAPSIGTTLQIAPASGM